MEPLTTRRYSLDAFRGITMFLLAAEAALLYSALLEYFPEGTFAHRIFEQFEHHPWAGLRFWDLIQPFFMFIVGVSMAYSLANRRERGHTERQIAGHVLRRSLILLLLGTGLHCVYNHKIVWELWNVLTQLSFTTIVAYLLMRQPAKVQIGVSLVLLVLTEILYRTYAPADPWVKDQNFGSWTDMLLMGKINPGGGWVTINCLPTAAHTIWGVCCGQLLRSQKPVTDQLKMLLMFGGFALLAGYLMHFTGITPIVKRIATSAFVLASGGWCLLALCFFVWLVDIRGSQRWAWTFVVVGMNPIFIYLFAETVGVQWFTGFVQIFNNGFLGLLGFSDKLLAVTNALGVLALYWYLCYFLYKKNIFIRI